MTWVWCELVCANCAKTTAGQFTRNGRVPVREMLAEAKKEGWVEAGDAEVCCSEKCRLRREKDQYAA